ncbi:hypothetical protein [Antrihabitans sp. YC2-6]|uniref:hypothetical protein n=1 Tax=Antrihabitans sp. YC2-6 TaxID=2799498 RepID=UPI0018F79FBE|nr:hypothetical protein [Antrihabitans sp. YC2-6]MBJ8343442.1 hypothetical protein [Antrihabitans sp. YC2-6]
MGTVRDEIDRRLEPWFTALAGDRTPYTNHVLRVLEFCDALYAVGGGSGAVPSSREEYLTAGAFHDLGIWSAGTFDYLGPSAELARD